MRHGIEQASRLLQHAFLYTVSLFVPARDRPEFRREWLTELWHVRCALMGDDRTLSLQAQRKIISFCTGAFSDARYLRQRPKPEDTPQAHVHGSAAQTLLGLAIVAGIFCLISHQIPGVRAENEAARYPVRPNVLLIGDAGYSSERASISTSLFRHWEKTPQRFFDALAFYYVARSTAVGGAPATKLKIAHATENLFSMLGLPIDCADVGVGDPRIPSIVLGRQAWSRYFRSDPRIGGRILVIDGARVRIAGVAPSGAWRLPGGPDAWLLEPEDSFAAVKLSGVKGYVVGLLSPRGRQEWPGPAATIAARDVHDNALDLSGVSVAVPIEGAWNIYAFALFLALAALPAVTSVSLGESSIHSHRPSSRQNAWRILFLVSKFSLVAIISFYASIDIAYSSTHQYSPFAECGQLFVGFAICLLGFRWTVADQRHRCPMCLRRVTNPASVGLASRTFLGWNGTEMMCVGGHALLHVPSLPTSWFSGQRWLYLDSSWDFLFGDSCVR